MLAAVIIVCVLSLIVFWFCCDSFSFPIFSALSMYYFLIEIINFTFKIACDYSAIKRQGQDLIQCILSLSPRLISLHLNNYLLSIYNLPFTAQGTD